eukprot:3022282-Ditylum_brightwellii.AAC.1
MGFFTPATPPEEAEQTDAASEESEATREEVEEVVDTFVWNKRSPVQNEIPQLIARGCTEVRQATYPASGCGHSFQAKYFELYPWLKWSKESNNMFCFFCWLCALRQEREHLPGKIWILNRSNHFKNLKKVCKTHNGSKIHKGCVLTYNHHAKG